MNCKVGWFVSSRKAIEEVLKEEYDNEEPVWEQAKKLNLCAQ